MDTSDLLCAAVRQRHDELAAGLEELRGRFRDGPAKPMESAGPKHVKGMADRFLADASRHVNAATDVLLPIARRLPDGKQVVHDYLHSARELEVVLAHVKAHEYGSTYEAGFSWVEVWSELASAMATHRATEAELARRLDVELPLEERQQVAERLVANEPDANTRPHPYLPHTGVLGVVGRKVMHAVDSFWDDAEGRMVPKPTKVHKKPGLVGQYLMADPRFDEDE